jgi:glycerol-3-phosphate acyltransferase PlsY
LTLSPGIGSLLLSLGFGFLCGSLPFGFIVGKLRGIDVRRTGSQSIGFTNVQRSIGLAWGVPVLVLDIAKGAVPAVLAPGLGLALPVVALGSVLGHVFTPWLGFRGGKGVATALGACGAVFGLWSLPLYAVYLLVLLIAGYVSVASLAFALLLAPLAALARTGEGPVFVFAFATAVVIIVRHLDNIGRLVAGTETRFGLWLKLFRRG